MKYLFSICLLFVGTKMFSQLSTTGGISPTNLVQNVLLGNGVSVSNITYNGSPGAIGSFTCGPQTMGLSSGIVITTGTISNNGDGPHGPNNKPDGGTNNGYPGYPLLNNQLGGNAVTYNAARLEFDFIPYSDTIRFRYVFGSEEYPEFVGSEFNDIFGFFITGPGFPTPTNIALVPNSNDVVAINNVNDGNNTQTPAIPASNPQYYVSNNNGIVVQYDGYTKVLEAVARVQCGQTYHLNMAIADVGDGIYDSGIFLEANSLSSNTPIEVRATLDKLAFPDPLKMAEGCVTATVKVRRTKNLNQTYTVNTNISGSATLNSDYTTNIPGTIVFNPGDSVKTYIVTAIQDGVTEVEENILIDFDFLDPCGNQSFLQLELKIGDIEDVSVVANDASVYCPGESYTISPVASGGVGPYTYQWSTGATTSSITVNPMTTTSYWVTVTDDCLQQSATDTITITVPVYPPVDVTTSPDQTVICPFIPDTLFSYATGGTGIYSYKWTLANGSTVGNMDFLTVSPPNGITVYKIEVTDECGEKDSAEVIYHVTSPVLELTTSPDTIICPFDPAQLSVSSTGGWGNHYYLWEKTQDTTTQITVNPGKTTYYPIRVWDDCGTFFVRDSILVKVVKPQASFYIISNNVTIGLPVTFHNTTINGSTYQWSFGDGNNSVLIHPNNTYTEPGFYDVELIATDDRGCIDTIVKAVEIRDEVYLYAPNAFTPDSDRYNNYFRVSTIGITDFNIRIYDRWGHLVFASNDKNFSWDGVDSNDRLMKEGVYTYVIQYSTLYDINLVEHGHVTLLK